MEIQVLWNIKYGGYPSFHVAKPIEEWVDTTRKHVFNLDKNIVMTMKEKRCKNFTVDVGFSKGGFISDKEAEKLLKNVKKIISFIKENKGNLDEILKEIASN